MTTALAAAMLNLGGTFMRFKASEKQIKQMATLACNASDVVFTNADRNLIFETKDFDESFAIGMKREVPGLFIDYIEGRMVKFYAKAIKFDQNTRIGDWEVQKILKLDFQSWCVTYPTWQKLIEMAD